MAYLEVFLPVQNVDLSPSYAQTITTSFKLQQETPNENMLSNRGIQVANQLRGFVLHVKTLLLIILTHWQMFNVLQRQGSNTTQSQQFKYLEGLTITQHTAKTNNIQTTNFATVSLYKEHPSAVAPSLFPCICWFGFENLQNTTTLARKKLLRSQNEPEISLTLRLALLVYILPISSSDACILPQQNSNYLMFKSVLKHKAKN